MNKYLILKVVLLLAVTSAMWRQMSDANDRWKTAEAKVKVYGNYSAPHGSFVIYCKY